MLTCCWGLFAEERMSYFKWVSCLQEPWERKKLHILNWCCLDQVRSFSLLACAMPVVGKRLIHQRGDRWSSERLRACLHLSHVREVFEEGCRVSPARPSEMSLSLWPKRCFRAVLIRDAALK